MKIRGIERLICEHEFFASMPSDYCALIGRCARNVRFDKGAYLFREGEAANEFFLIRHGRVALELTAPGRAPMRFLTINPSEIAGIAWLVPPYRWLYDARALELTRAVAIDGGCLRRKGEENHDFGYEMMKRFLTMLVERLHSAQLQTLDVYGSHA